MFWCRPTASVNQNLFFFDIIMPHDVAQILMLAQPRSGCHLLERILHQQSGVTYLGDECLVPGVVAQAQWLCDNDSMHCNPSAQKTTAYESAVGHASAVWREALDVANQAVRFAYQCGDLLLTIFHDRTKSYSS